MNNLQFKIRLMLKLICLIAISSFIFSCSYNPKKLTPSFIDTDRNTFREYYVKEVSPKIIFEFQGEYPLSTYPKSKGGLISVPIDQGLEMKRKYESYIRNKTKQEQEQLEEIFQHENLESFEYKKTIEEKIEQEKEILSGVLND